MKKLKEEVEFPQQAELSITIGIVTQFLKKSTGLHNSIVNQLQ